MFSDIQVRVTFSLPVILVTLHATWSVDRFVKVKVNELISLCLIGNVAFRQYRKKWHAAVSNQHGSADN